eukprot:2677016-Pleurochrysis_carterae.AAC.1
MSSVAQEAFLAKRDFLQLLKTDVFTAKKTLEMRLENFWPTRALERANTVFCKEQLADGRWRPRVLVPVPKGPRASNRALRIYSP